jgi:serine protease AprX
MGVGRLRIRTAMRCAAAIVAVAMLLDTAWTPSDAASRTPSHIDPALLAKAQSHPSSFFDVIVQAAPQKTKLAPHAKADNADRAGLAAIRAGGTPHRALGIIGGASATLRGGQLLGLSRDPDIAYIYADVGLSAKFDPQAGAAAVTGAGTREVNAPAAWTTYGVTGRGVGVAIVDSGIYAHPDLAGRIVASVDFTTATGGANTSGDPGGHGTHVAGLVAGDGTASGGAFTGVAPGANLIDVRVIDGTGASNLSTVLAGLQWVLVNRAAYNIRVVNLSLGSPEQATYLTSPLAAGVEVLAFAGVTVVVSAGNSGPGASTITMPGDDPFVITVGAIDDNGTDTVADDATATWSSNGPTTFDRLAKPDLVAPGRRMVSLRSPGSALDRLFPEREVTAAGASTADYFTLSGTSMAAPMVTGAVALMLEKQPTLRPRQVKQRLISTAQPLGFGTTFTRGAGLLDALAAVGSSATRSWRDGSRVSDGFAQIVLPLVRGQSITWESLSFNGGVDSRGTAWSSVTWDDISWDSVTWEDISWEDISWELVSWESVAAEDISWEMTFEPLSGGAGWAPVN